MGEKMKKTAILVDGAFFLKRYKSIRKIISLNSSKTANDLWEMCLKHLTQAKGEKFDLYRIFYYDCLPYGKKQHNPLTSKSIDFSKTPQYKFQIDFFDELKKKRKVALRLGVLEDRKRWIIKPQLNTLDRPGTVSNLKGATREELQQVVDSWGLDNIEIIAASPERKSIRSYRSDTETAIIETISRRPCTLDDLTKILGIHINEINKYLDVLDAEEKIEAIEQERGVFYQVKEK